MLYHTSRLNFILLLFSLTQQILQSLHLLPHLLIKKRWALVVDVWTPKLMNFVSVSPSNTFVIYSRLLPTAKPYHGRSYPSTNGEICLAVDILHLKYSRCSSNLNIPTFLISYHHLFCPPSCNPSRLQQLVDLKSGHILMVSVWGGRQTVIYLMTLLRIAATAYLIAHGRIHAVTAPVNVLEYLTHPSLQWAHFFFWLCLSSSLSVIYLKT